MDLFFGCLGNGTVVCDKSVRKHGDYKELCHISEHGRIEWYVEKMKIPEADLNRILSMSERTKSDFMREWDKKSYIGKWHCMMDVPVIGCGLNPFQRVDWDNRNLSMEERVKLMEPVFFETHI